MTTLNQAELETFFLTSYEPTPLLSPWNKGCGFFKANDAGLSPIENSTALRFAKFRDAITASRALLDEIGNADAVIRAIKARTKTTAKGFQSQEQRQILEANSIYGNYRQQLKSQIENNTQANPAPHQIADELSVLEELVRPASKPPTKAEADAIKASAGYKRLLAAAERRFKELKASLIPECRRVWRGAHAEWLSAAVVLDENGNSIWPSLLGTGGNDGNLDFTNNFMQQLGKLFNTSSGDGGALPDSINLLRDALWAQPTRGLQSSAIGQYLPGAAGGANSSTGFTGDSLVNPWDFILMMEGSVLFASRATRRLAPEAFGLASAPFAVRPHTAGYSTPGSEKAQRGEQWMPLWGQPTTVADLSTLLGEARAQLGRNPANQPIDMARAINRLGVARGLDSFVRYGYLERNGQSTLAVPLGRVDVPKHHNPHATLIDDLAPWMDRLRRRARDKNAPARLHHAERRLADVVFAALTHDHTPARWQSILLAAADVEHLQAAGTGIDAGPIPPLRPNWVQAVADGSTEFRLALALGGAAAGYDRLGRPTDSIRHHLLPLEYGARRFKTSDKRLVNDPRVVMFGRSTVRELAAIVERRLVEARQRGQRRLPLVAAAGCGANLADLLRFQSGAVDVERLIGLARAFMALKWDQWSIKHLPSPLRASECPDDCWLAIRLCNLAWPLGADIDIPADESVARLLISGDTTRAVEISRQRMRSVGFRPPMYAGVTDRDTALKWAACLAFPIHRSTAIRCITTLDPSKKGLLHA
jgi:CRISPR-associated protein Csx17